MSQANYKNQHLVSNIENTEENRDYVKNVNKLARKSESKYRLYIRYRKPVEGKKYGWGGSLRRKNAKAFSIYIEDKTPYDNRTDTIQWRQVRELQKENESLKKQIAILENPYMHWSLSDIESELFDVRLDCVDRFIDSAEDVELREKYNLLIQAQTIKEGECNA